MKIILKLKEHKERKDLLKDINKRFKDLGNKISKSEKSIEIEEESSNNDPIVNIPELNEKFFDKSWDMSIKIIESMKNPEERKSIFDNLTKDLRIVRKYEP